MSDAHKPSRSGPSGGKDTQAERQARRRQRREAEGRVRFEAFVRKETPAAIDALKRYGEDRGAVIDRLVSERLA